MDNLPTSQPQVQISPPPFYKRKILWIYLLILLLIPLSFYVFKTYFLNRAEQSTILPSPTAESLKTKKFLPERAMKSIYDLSKTSLTPKTATSSFDIKKTSEPQRLSASWKTADNLLVNISARYNQQGDVDEKNILLTLTDPINNLTEISAPTLITIYLAIQAKGSWKCDADTTSTILCENFWLEQDIKKWVGAVSTTPNEKRGRIFFCEYHPTSSNYNAKSCNIYE